MRPLPPSSIRSFPRRYTLDQLKAGEALAFEREKDRLAGAQQRVRVFRNELVQLLIANLSTIPDNIGTPPVEGFHVLIVDDSPIVRPCRGTPSPMPLPMLLLCSPTLFGMAARSLRPTTTHHPLTPHARPNPASANMCAHHGGNPPSPLSRSRSELIPPTRRLCARLFSGPDAAPKPDAHHLSHGTSARGGQCAQAASTHAHTAGTHNSSPVQHHTTLFNTIQHHTALYKTIQDAPPAATRRLHAYTRTHHALLAHL